MECLRGAQRHANETGSMEMDTPRQHLGPCSGCPACRARLERCPEGGMGGFPLHRDSCLWTFINTGLISKDTKESKCLAIVPGLLRRAIFIPPKKKKKKNYLDSCKCILFAKGNIECWTCFNSANTVILMYSLSGLGNLSCNLLLLLVVIFDSWKNEIRFNFKKFFFII